MSTLDDVVVVLAELGDAIRKQQTQLLAMMELTASVADAILASDEQHNALSAPRMMQHNNGWIIRQPLPDRGFLASYVNQDGTLIDQAFQTLSGAWFGVETTPDGKIVTTEERDALKTTG